MKLSDVPIRRQFGIELTFVPDQKPGRVSSVKRPYGFTHEKFYEGVNGMRDFLIRTGANYATSPWGTVNREAAYERWGYLHNDPGCVEWSSPVLRSWEEARQFYECATAIGEMFDFTPWHPEQVGGMGHQHMAMRRADAVRIVNDVVYRPYLPWLFAEPAQNRFCGSLTRDLSAIWNDVDRTVSFYDGSMHTLVLWNCTYGTLEWRGFDSACEWEEQEEHIAFYQRYAQWVLGSRKGRIPFEQRTNPEDVHEFYADKELGYGRCVDAFKALIGELRLPWDRYEWYTEAYLPRQFEWGQRL